MKPFDGREHFTDAVAVAITAIERRGLAAPLEVLVRLEVRVGQVFHVDVVAHAGAVLRRIVGAEDRDVRSLADRDFHGLPANWLDTYVPAVLDVGAAQMQALARARLPLERMTLVVVGDLDTVEPQLRKMPELKGLPMERVDPFAAE